MKFYWMPYLKLEYQRPMPKELVIGRAVFLPDDEDVWQNLVKSERPTHLQFHRDFPSTMLSNGDKGDPLYGTLVISEDEKWLEHYIDEAVSIVYFIGNEFHRNSPANAGYGRPSECFTYFQLDVKPGSDPENLVRYWTKRGSMTEVPGGLVIHPPLVVRYDLTRHYGINLSVPENQELVRRFEQDPQDRLVVAVRQFFRSQFSDTFRSHPTQDYAIHCAAIEAAMDLKVKKPVEGEERIGLSTLFANTLTDLYGDDTRLQYFFRGLYACRSIHVHGASSSDEEWDQAKLREKSYQYFMETNCKITLTRAITRDVIERQLGRAENLFDWSRRTTAKSLIWMAVRSSEIWDSAKSILTATKAAKNLKVISDEDFSERILPIAFDLRSNFSWQFVRDPINRELVRKAIVTCANLIGGLTNSTGEVYAASDSLGKLADARDYDEIGRWTAYHVTWKDVFLTEGDRLAAYQQIAYRMAHFFEKL